MKKKVKNFLMLFLMLVITIVPIQTHAVSQVEQIIAAGKSILGSQQYNGYCQSFVKWCYQQAGIYASTNASHALQAWEWWGVSTSRNNIPIGACVYFDSETSPQYGHVGIYIGNEQFIHAVSYASDGVNGVKISSFSSYWNKYYKGWGWQAGVQPNGADLDTKLPSNVTLSVNKPLFSVGETIYFSAGSLGATGYTIGIDRNGTRVYTNDIGTSFNISFTEPGDYSAYVSAWNSAGLVDSTRISFGIHGAMDLGAEFYAYIINNAQWLPIEVNTTSNVVLAKKETGMQNQLWKFTRMYDCSYKITSLLDGKVLDVDCGNPEPEANIKTEIFTDNPAQYWEIFGTPNNYKLKAKCSNCVMDCNGKPVDGQYNIQNYTYNNTDAQNLQIYKVSETFALGKPLNIGENFIAKIINVESQLPLAIDCEDNVILKNDNINLNQYWEFSLLDNGSYKIVSLLNNKALDVEYGSEAIEATVKTNLFLDHAAQFWEVFGINGNYKLKAMCTNYVLDVSGGSLSPGARLQTYVYNDTNAQKFLIEKVPAIFLMPMVGFWTRQKRY